MSISNKIEGLTMARNTIRTKMIAAGQATSNDKLATLANNLSISSGIDTSDATAYADDILEGKTAYARGQKITGTLQKGFNYKTWLQSAGISATGYANLAAVLADEVALRKLMTIHAAVDYLANWNSKDSGVVSVLNSDLAAKWITLRDYAEDTLTAAYGSLMASIGKYGYGEWCIVDSTTNPVTWGPKGNVPVMTSNTAPYGEAIYSAEFSSSYQAFYVFDKNPSTRWNGNNNLAADLYNYIGYKFNNPICVKRIKYVALIYNGYNMLKDITIEASNDGTNWKSFYTGQNPDVHDESANDRNTQTIEFSCNEYYVYWRMKSKSSWDPSTYAKSFSLFELQFYGRELKVSVPKMTGKEVPYGKAEASSYYSQSSYLPYYAFDKGTGSQDRWSSARSQLAYIYYKFPMKVCIKQVQFRIMLHSDSAKDYTATIDGSNDGVNWTTIKSISKAASTVATMQTENLDNNNSYLYYRFNFTSHPYKGDGGSVGYSGMGILQFFGKDYSEYDWDSVKPRHYFYDHGIEPNDTMSILYATRENSDLKFNEANGYIGTTLDISSYTLGRASIGSYGGGTTRFAIGGAISEFTSAYMPYNLSVDISNVNGSQATLIQHTAAGVATLEEFWLE